MWLIEEHAATKAMRRIANVGLLVNVEVQTIVLS